MTEHRAELSVDRAAALEAIEGAAELWGADWQPEGEGGRLVLPVVLGIRRGVLSGRLEIEETSAGGSTLRLQEEESHYSVNKPAFVFLCLGAAGGITGIFWPLWEPLLALAPISLVIAFSAWFLVASRLRTSSPEQFFDLVKSLSRSAAGEFSSSPPSEPA